MPPKQKSPDLEKTWLLKVILLICFTAAGKCLDCKNLIEKPIAVDGTNFVSKHGKLTLDGVQLVDENGESIQLVGMSSHGLHWFPDCYTFDSIKFLAENWGINVFRAAMYVGEGGYASNLDIAQDVKQIVQWCEQLGIYAIIDWHVLTPGDPNAWLDFQGANSGLAIDFWAEMANEYKNKPHVIYEIANEPNYVSWDAVLAYHNAVIGKIREIDADTIIIAGTTTWSQDIHLAAATPVDLPYNVMYAFHFYSGTHEFLYNRVVENANKIPIFVSEWGTSDASGNGGPYLDVAEKFLNLFSGSTGEIEVTLSWAQWSYADKYESSAALLPGSCSQQMWDATSCSGTYLKNRIKSHSDNASFVPPSLPTEYSYSYMFGEQTSPPSPALMPSPTPYPTILSDCPNAVWSQCDGQNWPGPQCCQLGSVCTFQNPYYSQCLPSSADLPTQPPTKSPTKSPLVSDIPTALPSVNPTSAPQSTKSPTQSPSISETPTATPTVIPTVVPQFPTDSPTQSPSVSETPTATPTVIPTAVPQSPTKGPTQPPLVTKTPTITSEPTSTPNLRTNQPTRAQEYEEPTSSPTSSPVLLQTNGPTQVYSYDQGSDDGTFSAECVEEWAQCGGRGYTGSTECCEGTVCVESNEWWSSCQYVANPNEQCQAHWQQCGGIGYRGLRNCCAGLSCKEENDYWSSCQ